jgi:uncharacterized protein (DUF1015 family)
MSIIKGFKGYRPASGKEKDVASVPYDVVNSAEAREMAAGNPDSFLRIVKAEIDLPEDIDVHSQQVYDKARENFVNFVESGVLVQDDHDCLYLYKQKMGEWEQVGLVAASSIEDYWNDIIKKHEFTRPVKEKDRIDHMYTTKIHSGPVFLTYPEVADIDAIVDQVVSNQTPDYDFEAVDGVAHTLWVVRDQNVIDTLVNLFATQVPATYIADGHHRAASSGKVGRQMAEENPDHNGSEEYNFFLSVLFPANQLHIIDYNRVFKDLNGKTPEELVEGLKEDFDITHADGQVKPASIHEMGLYVAGQWYNMVAKPHTYTDDPIGVLDVSVITEYILDKQFGITDQRTDDRVDFVGGIRGLGELEKRVDSGDVAAAVSLYPVTIQQLIDIADSGNVMPPKSTWFEPKLRSGVVVHGFE